MRILVVDDKRGLAHIIKMMVGHEGHQITFTRGVKDGYLTYLLFKPDVVITDVRGEIGLELVEIIRTYDPEVKLIYVCSDAAYWGPALVEEKTGDHVGLLQNPFSKGELDRLLSFFEQRNPDIERLK